MNNQINHNTILTKKKVNENEERNSLRRNKITSEEIHPEKNEVLNRKSVDNSLVMLNNCAKEMIEEFKNLSGSWEEHYRQYNDNINKLVHNMLKYSSDYKKKLEPIKTSSSDRRKKIEILVSIKEQFGSNI